MTRPDGTQRSRGVDLVFAYLVVVALVLGALAAILGQPQTAFLAQNLTLMWAGVVLAFLAGIVRAASLGAAGAVSASALLVLSALALFGIVWAYPGISALILIAGYALLLAHRRETSRIRFALPQLSIALAALLALALRLQGFL